MILAMDAIVISVEDAKSLVRAIELPLGQDFLLTRTVLYKLLQNEDSLDVYDQLRKGIESIESLVLEEDYER